eukprot:TRINITY_DN76582_c0_g1_i2.p1 TRINITY_DN76582_c0_g1~~TRINITY_DN76582_c0_g1_i2.p1  ORF type:complete len:324 (+),score=-22.51 TRINITY_DN76582_c0_g1_i2:103-972(+)
MSLARGALRGRGNTLRGFARRSYSLAVEPRVLTNARDILTGGALPRIGAPAAAPSAAGSTAAAGGPSAHTWQAARGVRTRPKLPVVLTTHVDGLGDAGAVVRVPAGFARNRLIPQRAALPALPKYLRQVERAMAAAEALAGVGPAEPAQPQQAQQGQGAASTSTGTSTSTLTTPAAGPAAGDPSQQVVVTVEDRVREAEEIARRLDSLRLSIRCDTPKKSTALRKPVTADQVISEVERQFGIRLSSGNVSLEDPIKTIGDYTVPLRFPPSVTLPGEREQIQLDVHVRRR